MKNITIVYDPGPNYNDDVDLSELMTATNQSYEDYLICHLQICEDELRLLDIYYSFLASQFLLSCHECFSIEKDVTWFAKMANKYCSIEAPQFINLCKIYWELRDLQSKHLDFFSNPEIED
jgi:hypothetical protein